MEFQNGYYILAKHKICDAPFTKGRDEDGFAFIGEWGADNFYTLVSAFNRRYTGSCRIIFCYIYALDSQKDVVHINSVKKEKDESPVVPFRPITRRKVSFELLLKDSMSTSEWVKEPLRIAVETANDLREKVESVNTNVISPEWVESKGHHVPLRTSGKPSTVAEYPQPILAARVKKKKESADKTTYTEGKEEFKKTLENDKELMLSPDKMIIEGVTSPIPVYFVPIPKNVSLKPEDCPIEGIGGHWEEQKEYAIRVNIKSSVLTAYRKTSEEGTRWASDGSWGESKRGEHKFKPVDPSKPNSPFLYWVVDK